MRFAENFFDFEVEEAIGINRRQHHGGISTPPGAADSDNIFIGTHQTAIRRHHGYFNNYLHPLTENAQGAGDNFTDSVGIELVAHRPADSGEEVGGGEHDTSLALKCFPVLLGELLLVWAAVAGKMGYRDNF